MKRSFFWLLVVACALSLLILGCSDQPSQVTAPGMQQSAAKAPLLGKVDGAQYVDSSYIVVFKDDVGDVDKEVNDISMQHAVKANFKYKHALKGFAGRLSAAAINGLQHNPHVAYIEQDQMAYAVDTQDPAPSWGLDRMDQRILPLDDSYTYNQTGADVDAYIIDTGIRTTHEDFGGRAEAGYDAITPGGTAQDQNGHGTHVAGTVGGTKYGVAKGVHLIAVRVLDKNGSGTWSQVIAGIDWVTGDHTTTPAVANMSLGGGASSSVDQAVRNSIAANIVYCVAAGNSGADASWYSPSRVTQAITVGATASNDAFASWSNYGTVVDLCAPGVSITSDWNTSNTATNTISGTSMATPHVTGAAALYLQVHPTASAAAVQSDLVAAATQNVITALKGTTANRLLYVGSEPQPVLPPSTPTLVSPGNGAKNVSKTPTLVWNASTGAGTYRVQVSTSSSFTNGLVSFDRSVTSTSVIVDPALNSRTVYYWRVNASSSSAGTSAWSSVWRFTTAR